MRPLLYDPRCPFLTVSIVKASTGPEGLQDWFVRSGVQEPLRTCMGPLPHTGAALVRWSGGSVAAQVHPVSPHPHHYRISVILEPLESQIWVDGEPVWGGVIGANHFRICAPGPAQQWRQLSQCDIANVFVPIETIEQVADMRGDELPLVLRSTPFVLDRRVSGFVRQMLESEVAAGPLSQHYCDNLMQAFLAYLLEHYARHDGVSPHGKLSGGRLRRLQKHMAEHLAEELSIPQLAGLCGMSESHFSREFKQAVGLPPHQYLLKLRLEHACELLKLGQASMVQIAFECGFNSASHFSRTFAARFGVAPVVYRRAQGVPGAQGALES